ncbi:ubiquitin ligase complex subunit HRD3 NDAI_0D00620 [Naumovozyma dairenensis CBS 421]|uniref:ERAD-associated E3 ubiquitin-protein ligase component HRD3 n=1 Tax=Naumovozyma dairenensis (strain ATCC 10597 / BCRC 20456 / CBS 421 / NBRC 0211 / NRRL Y-12639) TaxID=1071378 RepID=G0W9B5_NAUDC|nr:hypothetical protein NDAI_0D00620 [Naumovozyma dairenensis CBS 421]CCD24376.1 hypothetical protein NDAI_0D00620 [Naumovozyma dairenensis CBS 421]
MRKPIISVTNCYTCILIFVLILVPFLSFTAAAQEEVQQQQQYEEQLVGQQLEDPWNYEIQSLIEQLPPISDPLNPSLSSSSSNNTLSRRDNLYDKSFYLPMDYSIENEEIISNQFWSKNITNLQSKLYDSLLISSENFNNVQSTYLLSQIHLYGKFGFPQNKSEAHKTLLKFNQLTNFNNHTALFDLAMMYSTGLFGTIPIDISKSLIYFQKSASLGNLMAKQVMAYKYYMGLNVPRDFNKALLLYNEISTTLRTISPTSYFKFLHWDINFPDLETFQVRILDFNKKNFGLLGKGLSSVASSITRRKAIRPDITSSVLTQMNPGGQIVLQFGLGADINSFSLSENDDRNEDDVYDEDQLVDLFYTAWDLYKGTYTQLRDVPQAKRILEKIIKDYENDVDFMDNLQRFFFSKSLDLLGHIYFMGEHIETPPNEDPKPDLNIAIHYLERAVKVLETSTVVKSRANVDLALICHYAENNIPKALGFYNKMVDSRYNNGNIDYQLSKLAKEHPDLKNLGDPMVHLQNAFMKRYPPAVYDYAKMLESGVNGKYNVEETTYIYKAFAEEMEPIMAPHLQNAFRQLLLGNIEIALWEYSKAAEQGYETAQVSAASLMYQTPFKFEPNPTTTPERKNMAITYFSRAFKQNNVDAGVVAGDIYYDMGQFDKAISIYQSAALKMSPQAVWDLGYMYEHGLGVPKDIHLAKRYYDQILEINHKLFIASKLSVWKLQFNIWIDWLKETKIYKLFIKLILNRIKLRTTNIPFVDMMNPIIPIKQSHMVHNYTNKLKSFIFQETKYLTTSVNVNSNTTIISRPPRKIIVQPGLESLRGINGEQHADDESFFSSLGLNTEDLLTMGLILFMFLMTIVLRIVGPRQDWNIGINGIPIQRDQDDREGQDGGNAGAPRGAGGIFGNLDIQVVAI